jgi:hypothetical protein
LHLLALLFRIVPNAARIMAASRLVGWIVALLTEGIQ